MTTYRVWNGTSWEYIDNQNYDARYLLRSELGSNSGAASLDSGGHIPMVQVPSALTGAVNYQGTFNPIGGAPTPAGKGYYYVANTSGTVDATAFATGDWLIYTDSFTWEKLDNTGSSVIWEHVVDKPASYPPSSHNNSAHSETYLTTDGMAANSTLWDGIGRPLFAGNATKYMRLNEAGNALEFATVASGGGGITWNEVTGTTQSASADNGYITNNESLVTVTLPSTCAVGKTIRVAGKGAGLWKIAQNAGQQIIFGNKNTTSGTSGYVSAIYQYDSVELLCITADTVFSVIGAVGDLDVV